MAEITETHHRLRCDNCQAAVSPTADSKFEAKILAKHVGWVIYKGKAWCIECFTRLDATRRMEMLTDQDT